LSARLTTSLLFAALLALPCAAASAASDYRGKLQIRHSDDFARGHSVTKYRLKRHGRRIPLVLAKAPRTPSGSRVVVRGRRVGSRLKGTLRPGATLRSARVTPGPRKTAVILVNFTSDTRQPWTTETVRQRVFTAANSTNAFYQEDSYGDVSLVGKNQGSGDIYGWYTVTDPGSDPNYGCNVDAITSRAQSAAAADGFSATGYQHIIYAFPAQASCGGWAGLGEVPGTQSWMNGNISTRVVAHELGHNMGLHHASSLACTESGTPVTIAPPSSCVRDEYGDPFDVMGSNLRRNNAWHLRQIGFMPQANERTITDSGTYTVSTTNTRGSEPQLLRVQRPSGAAPAYYDLELRSAGGLFDTFLSTDPAVQGVTIHTDPVTTDITQSLLLDATPGSAGGFGDAPLAPGNTFTDGAIAITVQSVSAGTATLDIDMSAPPADVTAPNAPDPLSAQASPDQVELSWPASTDDVGVSGYRVTRNGYQFATVTSPGWTDTSVQPGATYTYRVSAYDAAGNYATSAPLSVTVPAAPAPEAGPGTDPEADPGTDPGADPATPQPQPIAADITAPSVRIVAPARGATLRRRAVVRAAATDNARVVKIEVWIDGKRRRVVRAAAVKWRWSLRRVRAGRHTVAVRAFDSSGNSSVATVRVRRARGR
jgi:M6 family metalloprotease-like protein